MSSPTQSNLGSAAKRPLTRTDKFIVALFLFIALWMIADAVVFNHQRTVEMLARNAHASYCDNAPECYMVGDGGLEFGYQLDAMVGSEAWTKPWNFLDLDKLAHAVAHAETSHCTTGVGATHNNCFGIRYNGKFARYATKADSFTDFKRIWMKPKGYYKGEFPTWALADKWTGKDSTADWLEIVNHYYFTPNT